MPRQSGLLERQGRFYLNMRVPNDLRPLYGKKEIIRRSLDTSDRSEAISRVRFEAYKLDSEFEAKRRELKNAQPPPTVLKIDDREAHDLVCRWFIQREKDAQEWWDAEGCKFDETDTELALDNLRVDEAVYSGGNKDYRVEDGSGDLDVFLKAEGLECPKDSSAYQKLVQLFTKARLENVRRSIARVTHQTVTAREPLFREVFAHTSLRSKQQVVTVGKVVERFLEYLKAAKRSDKTLRTYKIPCRLLREELGEKTPVESITKERMEELYGLLRRAPSNVTKRYLHGPLSCEASRRSVAIVIGDALMEVLNELPQQGWLFPNLAKQNDKVRSSRFRKRADRLGYTEISLHSYRYAWAQRAKSYGMPMREAMAHLGHGSKAVHHAYSDKAEIVNLPLEFYEKQWKEKIIQFTKAMTAG